MKTIRWGILSTGNIARQFALGLQAVPDAELVAVGSRSQESADQFGDKFDVPRRHSSYEALAEDPEVDIIYIGTPHTFHRDNSILCLQAGKHVLCEKPFTINRREAEVVVAAARDRGLFLMEAMWTRFLPLMVRLRQLLAGSTIGELLMVSADFGFRTSFDPDHRLFNPELGGGALLDVGVYPVSLAHMLLGAPEQIRSLAHLGQTGVDEQTAILLGYPDGKMALLATALRLDTAQEAVLMGSGGQIRVHYPWWYATDMTIQRPGQEERALHLPYEGNGYNYQAVEAMACLRAGKLESDIMPLDETLAVMGTLDAIRSQWGLRYPSEM